MILIFANGEMPRRQWVRPHLARASLTIAADGGLRHLLAVGARPDVVIGDLDSLPAGVEQRLTEQGTAFIRHPRAKDETDLELALLYALEHGTGEILVFGALGGRVDQTLANILFLLHPALAGRPVALLTEYQRAWAAAGEIRIVGRPGDRVSLIPLVGDAQVKTTRGLQWALQDESLLFGLARGVSNVMTADEAVVVLESGQVLCVHTKKEWER